MKNLDLGCGNRKRKDTIGIDISEDTDADVIHDLNISPYPFDYNGKSVLITGAKGFIGTHLTTSLLKQGACVAVLDQKKTNSHERDYDEVVGDLRDSLFVERCIQEIKPEVIFHLAAYKERGMLIESFADAVSINVAGSLNLFTMAQRHGSLKSLVVMGTTDEYGSNKAPFSEGMRETPISAYSYSKLCVTHLCQVMHTLYKLPCVVLRPTVVYGPGQALDMFLPALIQTLIDGEMFPMTEGAQTRDFLYITDLINAMLVAGLSKKVGGQIINIGSGSSLSIAKMAYMIESLLGRNGLVQCGAVPYRSEEIMDYRVNLDKASCLLGWKAKVDYTVGLKQTISYYREISNL